jgi:hypothetical protein
MTWAAYKPRPLAPRRPEDIGIFDTRFGYTAEEAEGLLNRWGPAATKLYVLLELVDIFLWFPNIFAVMLINYNWILTRIAHIHRPPAPFLLIIPLLFGLDMVEDLSQLGLIRLHKQRSPHFAAAVQVRRAASWGASKLWMDVCQVIDRGVASA